MLKYTLEPQEFTHYYGDTWYTLETFAPIELELVSSIDELGLSPKERKNVIDIGSQSGQYFLKTSLGLKDAFLHKGMKKVVTLYDVDPESFGPIQFRELFFSTLHSCKKEPWFSVKETVTVPISLNIVVSVPGDTKEENRLVVFNTEDCDILSARLNFSGERADFLLRLVKKNEVFYFVQDALFTGAHVFSVDYEKAITTFSRDKNTNDPQLLRTIFGAAIDWIE